MKATGTKAQSGEGQASGNWRKFAFRRVYMNRLGKELRDKQEGLVGA